MQHRIIVNAFKDSGIWPESPSNGIKKMRSYQKRREAIDKEEKLDLLLLPPSRPLDLWTTAITIQRFGNRDPTLFSDSLIELFKHTMNTAGV